MSPKRPADLFRSPFFFQDRISADNMWSGSRQRLQKLNSAFSPSRASEVGAAGWVAGSLGAGVGLRQVGELKGPEHVDNPASCEVMNYGLVRRL